MSADHSEGEPLAPVSPLSMLPAPSARPPAHLCECNQWVRRNLDEGADGHHPVCTAEAAKTARAVLHAPTLAEQSIDLGAAVREERAEAQPAGLDIDAIRARMPQPGWTARSPMRFAPDLTALCNEVERLRTVARADAERIATLRAQVHELEAESDGRRRALIDVDAERRTEWMRAERMAGERDTARKRILELESALRLLALSVRNRQPTDVPVCRAGHLLGEDL